MSNHTPGPWTTRGGLVLVGDESNSGNVIAIVNCGGKGGLSLETKAIEANARLIAAAPDLLEQLELAATALEQASADKDRRIAVREADSRRAIEARGAIAKAKGSV